MNLDKHVCVGRNEYFVDFASVDIVNGGGEREDSITSCAAS